MRIDSSAFAPGSYWSPERAAAAVDEMARDYVSPAMQAILVEASQAGDMESVAAAAGIATEGESLGIDFATTTVEVRRGRPEDVPQLVPLIIAGSLPPLFIDPFLGGFAVAVCGGTIIGCGGLEVYDDCGVIRSVVVHADAQGIGLGRVISDLLVEDARLAGVRDCYLFTAEAHEFWLHLGFRDVAMDDWLESPRRCWQWQFLSDYAEQFGIEVFSMWKRL